MHSTIWNFRGLVLIFNSKIWQYVVILVFLRNLVYYKMLAEHLVIFISNITYTKTKFCEINKLDLIYRNPTFLTSFF